MESLAHRYRDFAFVIGKFDFCQESRRHCYKSINRPSLFNRKFCRKRLHLFIEEFTWNQSMVQQLTIAGNFLIRFLKPSPIGLIAKTTCNCSRRICTKKLNKATGLPSVWTDLSRCLSICLIFSQSSTLSSIPNRFGTSPEFNKLLRSSRNDSSFIYLLQFIFGVKKEISQKLNLLVSR